MGALGGRGGVWAAAVQYALQLAAVYVFALIADNLAPRFGGQQDQVSAFKLAAYSYTASWVAGIFMLIPALAFLTILGLYSLYLLYTGAPVLMKVPQDRTLSYTIVIILVGIVLSFVVGAIAVAVFEIDAEVFDRLAAKFFRDTCANRAISVASRVLPIPGSPASRTNWRRPSSAAV